MSHITRGYKDEYCFKPSRQGCSLYGNGGGVLRMKRYLSGFLVTICATGAHRATVVVVYSWVRLVHEVTRHIKTLRYKTRTLVHILKGLPPHCNAAYVHPIFRIPEKKIRAGSFFSKCVDRNIQCTLL